MGCESNPKTSNRRILNDLDSHSLINANRAVWEAVSVSGHASISGLTVVDTKLDVHSVPSVEAQRIVTHCCNKTRCDILHTEFRSQFDLPPSPPPPSLKIKKQTKKSRVSGISAGIPVFSPHITAFKFNQRFINHKTQNVLHIPLYYWSPCSVYCFSTPTLATNWRSCIVISTCTYANLASHTVNSWIPQELWFMRV